MGGRTGTTALVLALALSAGCKTTYTIRGQEQHTARLRVTSDPPGATVYLDQVPRGQTPAELDLGYTLVKKDLHPAERKQGWWMLGTGLAAMVTGAAVGAWGFSNLGDTDADPGVTAGKAVAGTYAVVGAIYGLYGLISGIYYLAKNPADIEVNELTPQQVTVGVNLPGEGLRQARLSPVGPPRLPRGRGRWRVHFSTLRGRWEARLPAGLQLADASPASTPAPVAIEPPPALPAPPAPAGRVDEAGDRNLIEDLRGQGETCYRKRDYRCALQKFERAFALQPTPAMRFNVASALDKLGRAALAIRQYRHYLNEAGDAASPSAIAHIQKRMKVLMPRVGLLRLAVAPAGASATLDGVPLSSLGSSAKDGKHEVVVDPGTYRLDVSQTGHLSRSINVTLNPGEVRGLEVKLVHATGREDEP